MGWLFGLPTLMDESVFEDSKVTFQAGTHFRAWLFRLAMNGFLDSRRGPRGNRPKSLPAAAAGREPEPVATLLSQETLNQFHTERVKVSFVLFDEIEKASDALWNLLLGILDKATLTLGDNRRVDFSRAMIFMTSNLGAAEMNSMMTPRLGFSPAGTAPRAA